MVWKKECFIGRVGLSVKAAAELWYGRVGNDVNKELHFHLFQLGWYERLGDPNKIVIVSLIVPFISFHIAYRRCQ